MLVYPCNVMDTVSIYRQYLCLRLFDCCGIYMLLFRNSMDVHPYVMGHSATYVILTILKGGAHNRSLFPKRALVFAALHAERAVDSSMGTAVNML